MNLAEIETFLTIVNTKSITKTADLLFLSQPTVSHRLTSLENDPQQRSQAGRAHPKGNGFYHPRRTLDVSLERNT